MRVAQVSFSSSGGAGRVATLLNKGINSLGVESMHFLRTESNLREDSTQVFQRLVTGFDNYLVSPNTFDNQVSLFRSKTGSLKAEHFDGFDVVHLHWTPGLVSLREILRISDRFRTVITLHDYFFFTGGCHFNGGCKGFQSDCLTCPAVHKPFQKEISQQLELKKSLAAKPNVTFTTPSPYMRDLASASSALSNADVVVIGNPVDVESSAKINQRRESTSAPKFLFVAENMNDPRKGFNEALEILLEIKSQEPSAEFHVAGGGQVSSNQVTQHGKLNKNELTKLMSEMDWLLIASKEEVAPNIIAEAASLGLPSLILLREWNKKPYSTETGQLVFKNLPPKEFNNNHLQLSERAIDWSRSFETKKVSESFLGVYQMSPNWTT